MQEPHEPQHQQRSIYQMVARHRWSIPSKIFLGLYLGIYLIQVVSSLLLARSSPIDASLSLSLAKVATEPWRPLTFFLFHSPKDPFHFLLVFGSLAVILPDLEERLGRRFVGLLFVVCAMGAGSAHLLFTAIFLDDPTVRTLGASGAVYGMLIAYLWYHPETEAFGLLKGKILAPILLGVVFISGFQSRDPTVEYRAQAASVLIGVGFIGLAPAWRRIRGRWKTHRQIHRIIDDVGTEARIDVLLDKISRDGLDSLTSAEKRFLEKASQLYQDGPHEGGGGTQGP